MSMAAGAAVLRSVATKMARAPPRRLAPTSSGGGLGLPSRFSTSAGGGSMPPPPNLRGPQPHNNKVPSGGSQWYRAIEGFNDALPIAAMFLFGGYIYVHSVANPAMDRMEASLDAELQERAAIMEEIKKSNERIRAIFDKKRQAEAADVSLGQGMENL